MAVADSSSGDLGGRATAWRHAAQAAVCDVQRPWAHGTIIRATRYPNYFDFNAVRVEDDPGMEVQELARLADQALDGLAHRRVDFDLLTAGQPLRAGFAALGWKASRLLWLRHELPVPAGEQLPVELVEYDAVAHLRLAWHREDFPNLDVGRHHADAREVALSRGAQVLAVHERGAPVAFAQLERVGDGAEISQVYVQPGYRGSGRGTAVSRAAISAAGGARDLWICADDEDRPKRLYLRLGFRPVGRTIEFLRLP